MQLVFEKNFTVTTGMFDEYSSLKPYAILDIFQRIAGDHANKLDIGTQYCDEHNYGWILARQEVHIYKNPLPEDTVVVKTFPHFPGKIEFKREYEMRSLSGEILIKGCAMWVLVDFNTHKMLKSDNIYPSGEFIESVLFKEKLTKPKSVLNEGKLIDTYHVTKSDIDLYHHMNNAKYAEVMFNYYDFTAKDITHFALNYQSEIKQNESMHIYKLIDNDITYITGVKDGTTIFTSSIKTKENK